MIGYVCHQRYAILIIWCYSRMNKHSGCPRGLEDGSLLQVEIIMTRPQSRKSTVSMINSILFDIGDGTNRTLFTYVYKYTHLCTHTYYSGVAAAYNSILLPSSFSAAPTSYLSLWPPRRTFAASSNKAKLVRRRSLCNLRP